MTFSTDHQGSRYNWGGQRVITRPEPRTDRGTENAFGWFCSDFRINKNGFAWQIVLKKNNIPSIKYTMANLYNKKLSRQ